MQDLSQPKSETSPPDGALDVPLLRHQVLYSFINTTSFFPICISKNNMLYKLSRIFGQRIALSWMVQKETSSVPCAGGILADDQVSTRNLFNI